MRALGSNPLIRASDRLEACTALAVVGTALFAVAVAAQAGSQIYDAGVSAADEQAHTRHSVAAVALDSRTTMPIDFDNPAHVRAQWHEGAQLRTERIVSPTMVKAGQPLTIWLDETGKVVTAPLTAEDARLSALVAASTVWIALVASSLLLALVVRRRLDRSRDRAWERELRLMAHNDDGWANRHI